MNITIIGSGNVGGALAQSLLKANHNVLVGAKLPLSNKSQQLAATIGADRFSSVPDAIAQSQVIIITTPPEAVLDILQQAGDVRNKIVIDATNSVRTKPDPYPTVFHAVKALGKTAKVVKCFNTTGFENLLNPNYNGSPIDMFVAGDDYDSKQTAMQIAQDIGFGTCFDFGGDNKVILLEEFALCWINLAIVQKAGRNIAFKVLRR